MPYEIAPTSSFATEEHVQEHLEGLLEDGHDQDEMKSLSKLMEILTSFVIMKTTQEWLTNTTKRQ